MDLKSIISSLSAESKKIIATSIMSVIGLLLIGKGLILNSGLGFMFFMAGIILFVVGIIPIAKKWIEWQFSDWS